MHPAFRSAAGIGTELCQLDSADLDVLPHVSKNIRKRCEEERMYMDTKEKVVRFCKGDKSVISDSKTHKIYRCPHCRQKIRVPRGKGKSRSPVLPAAVNLSNGPDSCSFCMNLLKIAGNMLVHHRKKYYT